MHDSENIPVRPVGNQQNNNRNQGKVGEGNKVQEGRKEEGQDGNGNRGKGKNDKGISWHSQDNQVLATGQSAAAAAEVEEEGLETAGAEVISEEKEEEDEGKAVGTAIAPRPYEPTKEEIEQHIDNQHIPYRNWCEECVKGRATGEKHVQ